MSRLSPAALLCAVLLLAGVSPARLPAGTTSASQEAAPESQAIPVWQLRTEPAALVNGAPAVLYVAAPAKLQALSGSSMGHELFFSFDPASETWYALFGVDLNAAPGKYPLALHGKTDSGSPVSFQQDLEVARQPYAAMELQVARQFTAPSPRVLRRIRREEILKRRVFAESSSRRLWHGPFIAPVREPVTEAFGVRRIFNGELRSEHEGLDYHAPRGTPVRAANSGRVVLARRLFFEGNCVIVDHGQGLMTLYMHFSKFKVKAGQRVRPGQLLGFSGATGRVTGPHLHLAVRWEGMYLDPARLLTLDLPRAEETHSAVATTTVPAEKLATRQSHGSSQN